MYVMCTRIKLTFSEVDGWLGTTVITNTRRSPLDLMLAAMYDQLVPSHSHGTSTLTHDMTASYS